MCVAGQGTCVNNCSAGGTSQSGSPYTDNQNANCPYGGCSECTTGDCCNSTNGCYRGTSYTCLTGTLNSPAAGSCQRPATNRYCSANSSVCDGTTYNVPGYATNNGWVWNSTTWAPASPTNTCPSLSAWECSGQQIHRHYYGCTTAGVCSVT